MRPEDLKLVPEKEGIPVTVELLEELGSDAFLHASVRGSEGLQVIVARVDPQDPPPKGSDVALAPTAAHLHWFETASGNRIA